VECGLERLESESLLLKGHLENNEVMKKNKVIIKKIGYLAVG
jgi:hypothetical protein